MLLLCILLPCNILILEQFVVFVQPTLIQDAKAKVEFVMMCIVHNIEKIGNFIKKHKKNLKNVLENGINESSIAKNIAT